MNDSLDNSNQTPVACHLIKISICIPVSNAITSYRVMVNNGNTGYTFILSFIINCARARSFTVIGRRDIESSTRLRYAVESAIDFARQYQSLWTVLSARLPNRIGCPSSGRVLRDRLMLSGHVTQPPLGHRCPLRWAGDILVGRSILATGHRRLRKVLSLVWTHVSDSVTLATRNHFTTTIWCSFCITVLLSVHVLPHLQLKC